MIVRLKVVEIGPHTLRNLEIEHQLDNQSIIGRPIDLSTSHLTAFATVEARSSDDQKRKAIFSLHIVAKREVKSDQFTRKRKFPEENETSLEKIAKIDLSSVFANYK
jgi:hypothetical protein